MASLGHVAIGLAAGRWYTRSFEPTARPWKWMLAFSVISMVPDFDVIGFKLGVRYADEWGHRGATHSLVFALLSGGCLAGLARLWGVRALPLGALGALVMASHPLLDMLTDGGLGCALWWPASLERLFFPVTPIPVAPIGARMLSARGLQVALTEVLLFAPCWWFAWRQGRTSNTPSSSSATRVQPSASSATTRGHEKSTPPHNT